MNKLKVMTWGTDHPDAFDVHWTNNLIRPCGVIRITVPGVNDDKMVVAELRAIQYLLEERWALGEHVIGNPNTHLIVSLGAIKKLKHGRSDKTQLARHAEFLCTRFAGCRIEVAKDDRVFRGEAPERTELMVTAPQPEIIDIRGIGPVGVTRHVLERLAERLPAAQAKDPARIWKRLQRMASDPSVREVNRHSSLYRKLAHKKHEQHEGRYFLNPKLNMILVVTDNARGRNLVTTYMADSSFIVMATAA
ncbi:MAG: hypothetical protein ACYCY8_06580 [Burkholderiales bacterium]